MTEDKEVIERLLITNPKFREIIQSLKAAHYVSYSEESDNTVIGGEWTDCVTGKVLCSFLGDREIYSCYAHSGEIEKWIADCNSPEEAIGVCELHLTDKGYRV